MNPEELLDKARERIYTEKNLDAEDDNILYILNREYDEAHTHSRILFYLLTRPYNKDKGDSFLHAFLRQINVPEIFIKKSKWTVYRERCFGEGRIDFVLESSDYVVAIEMKLRAGDGDLQLERYDRFCKSRRKEYGLYYLTPDGHEPADYSMGSLDKSHFHCISFEKDILEWLEECMDYTENGGYKYSLIKQYIGTIRQITGKGAVLGMSGLINDSESALAVIELAKELENKMADVMVEFLDKLLKYVKSNTKCEWKSYDIDIDEYFFGNKKTTPGFFTIIDELQIGTIKYRFFCCVEITNNLYIGFGFDRVKKNGEEDNVDMNYMRGKDADFYNKCLNKMEELPIRDIKKESSLYWAYIENTKGEKLDFKNWNKGVIELIDDMDVQIEYIGEYIVTLVGLYKR